MNIFIVEDEPLLLRVLERAFARAGYQVKGTGSGFEAFEILSQQNFDFVMMDVQLYGLNAPELLRQLDQIGRRIPRNRLVIMSAYPRHVVDSLFSASAQDQVPDFTFLQKPFEDVLKLVTFVESQLKA